ncbi:GNAT family N-acetyltransferase [Nocardioides sp.]|uniref:GNAT family N-acetyltransferase n=1 Tax=Nocardioides sp. TaxID=35761 RepID=UPI0027221FAA|nr:GNAT family N-acetyltransferase [Nocardioides sp.]MDO9458440.1 GNAT family N-acetyltransferase [Nocardioides sp.]
MPDLTLQPVADPPFEELAEHLVHRRFLAEQVDPDRAREAADTMVVRVRERTAVLDVLGEGERVGRVWLVEQGDDRSVLRLALDDPDRAPAVRALLEVVARDAGARRLTAGVYPGDPVTEAFVADGGFETAAVQMRLDLGQELPAEDVVTLEPMDAAAYDLWEADEIDAYAEARTRSGESPEHALKVSREQHAELLPDGLATEHHQFFVGRVDGLQVGTLWVGTERPIAFVYDVAVDEDHRRRGYGGGLMRAGALWAQQQGSHALGLNVFGYNHGARALYEGLGYETVELYQGKEL